MGLLREEERQRAAQELEVALGRVRVEMERVRQDLERSHAAERELAQEKVSRRSDAQDSADVTQAQQSRECPGCV